MKFKVGDKVLVKSNSHYGSKPRKIVKVTTHLFYPNVAIYHLYGARLHYNKKEYLGFTEDDLVAEEIWNSPLYKALLEDD